MTYLPPTFSDFLEAMAEDKKKSHFHGHRERLRKRLRKAPESLEDYEVLELLLGYVITRKDTKPLAKELLADFSTIGGVFQCRDEELQSVHGFGPSLGDFWQVLRELAARIEESPIRHREILCSPEAVAAMARRRLGHLAHEEVWIAFVDNQNRNITWERLIKGTLDSSPLYPREVLQRALVLKASGFILVHNHPGGNIRPSGADLELTEKMQLAAQQVSVRFLDHVIVTESACFSLMRDGFL